MRQPFPPAIFLLLVAGASVALGQTSTYTVEDAFGDLPPPSTRGGDSIVPKLAFSLEAEIALPGPLPRTGPRLREGSIEIDVADGTLLTKPTADATPLRVVATTSPIDPHGWVLDPTGDARYRSTAGGWIEAQKRCGRCKRGWKRRWRLRVAGNTLAPPIVVDGRVYFGALDNRVYCVKAKNGHRVWLTDVGARVSLPLVHWQGNVPASHATDPLPPREMGLILAVPDPGTRLVALLRSTGEQVASVRLENGSGQLVSAPVATAEGKIVVARQAYAASEASLLVYALLELATPPAPVAGPGAPVPASP